MVELDFQMPLLHFVPPWWVATFSFYRGLLHQKSRISMWCFFELCVLLCFTEKFILATKRTILARSMQ